MSFNLGLIIISVIAGGFWLIYLWIIKGILYFGPNTDNKFLALSAAQSPRWRWLSDLHKMALTKTGMMEMTIIGISWFQKLFKNKTGDYPYMAWGGFTTAVSAFLIYLIGANYWTPAVGLILSVLLITSFWLWQIALYGGHANTAAMIFLLSVYIVQQTHAEFLSPTIWLFLGGILYALTQFSSRSSSKYTPLFLAAVFHERFTQTGLFFAPSYFWPQALVLVMVILTFVFTKLTYRKIVTAMYFKKTPDFLNKIITNQDQLPLEHYIKHAKNKINYYFGLGIPFLVFLIATINLLGLDYFWPVALGSLCFLLIFALPDIKNNLKYVWNIIVDTQIKKKSHFRLYVDYFAKKGITVSRDTQGGGWRWLPKIFFRMAPWHSVFFLISLFYLAITTLTGHTSVPHLILITLTSLSPILWAQLTRAPQISRTFSPGLISMLLLIGYFLSIPQNNHVNRTVLWVGLLSTVIWNLWKFFSDVYPARMTAANLTKTLLSLNIKECSTYETEYNNNVVNVIDQTALNNIKINYIKSLSEVKDGWIVIPGTSSKAMNMSSERESVREGNYDKDPILNQLLKTGQIEKRATAKFKSLGTSNIWVHESEVASYRDLILKEVTDQDRFRGYTWLIHSSQLKN